MRIQKYIQNLAFCTFFLCITFLNARAESVQPLSEDDAIKPDIPTLTDTELSLENVEINNGYLNRDDLFHDIENLINEIELSYIDKLDEDEIVRGVADGLASVLDPHSSYISPEGLENIKNQKTKEYVGIGIEIMPIGDLVVIEDVMDNSPAKKAGIKGGSFLYSVDGKEVKNMSFTQLYNSISGDEVDDITLKISRNSSFEELETFTLKREEIKIESVSSKDIGDNIFYIRIREFTNDTAKLFSKVMKSNDKKSLIIDLRGNPGGLLHSAVNVADFFLSEQEIVSIKGRNKEYFLDSLAVEKVSDKYSPQIVENKNSISFIASKKDVQDLSIVILVDNMSASGAEILASALQQNNAAIVVGEVTFGKGSVQSIVELDDLGAMKITTAHYFGPNQTAINKIGVMPDILVNRGFIKYFQGRKMREDDLFEESSIEDVLTYDRNLVKDIQLSTAISILNSLRIRSVKNDNNNSDI